MLGAVFPGTLAGFAIGGGGEALQLAVPLLTVLALTSGVLRSGPTLGRLAIATVLSVAVVFGSVTGRKTLAIAATCLACCYAAVMRWLAA